jgi:preprotein translocase subunit SecY
MANPSNAGFDLSILSKAHELKSRIFFTIMALIVCRIGSYIPIPGVNPSVLSDIAAQNSQGILGMFNMLSGGSLGRMSIFALAIMPYITASIIMQLMTVLSKRLEAIKKEGESGKKKINQFTRYATVILSAFQGFGIAVSLESLVAGGVAVVPDPGMFFKITTVVSLSCGTLLLMWIGEQITSKGIGNGTSLIIFTGIVAEFPSAIIKLLELGRAGAISPFLVLLLFVFVVGLIGFVVFMERAQRRILVQYPKRQVGNKVYGGEGSHLPLKLNTSGVIPPIFANAILLFPLTIANFTKNDASGILNTITSYLAHGKPLYILLYVSFIVFFCFFYTAIVFNPVETADNLKKYGGIIPGRKPGKNTADYLDFILTRLTVIGAFYISIVCALPEVLMAHYTIPFYLGGTSILIVVNVVIDTISQVQTHLFSYQYEGLMKKAKLKDKVRDKKL